MVQAGLDLIIILLGMDLAAMEVEMEMEEVGEMVNLVL